MTTHAHMTAADRNAGNLRESKRMEQRAILAAVDRFESGDISATERKRLIAEAKRDRLARRHEIDHEFFEATEWEDTEDAERHTA